MIHRQRIVPPPHIYPADPWRIVEKGFAPRFLGIMESVFSVSNGYLGIRGVCDEGEPMVERGTYVNGFHETWPIVYGEAAYGFAKTGQTIVNLPCPVVVRLLVDDEPLYLPTASLERFERSLDMQNGVMKRELLWETPLGKHVSWSTTRMVSYEHRHLGAVVCRLRLDADAPVVLVSELSHPGREGPAASHHKDPRLSQFFDHRCLESKLAECTKARVTLGMVARESRMAVAMAMDHVLEVPEGTHVEAEAGSHSGRVVIRAQMPAEYELTLVKFFSVHTSSRSEPEELCWRCGLTLDRAMSQGWNEIAAGQRSFMDDFWQRSDVQLELDPDHSRNGPVESQQAVRFNIFQVMAASARAEGSGIPAKGLTGQAYEGHFFWDQEIYILPFLSYTSPQWAENVLRYRLSMLDKARERARELGQAGALFPWRTINGSEASAYYAAGTAQYHINADVAYALRRHFLVSGEEELLEGTGGQALVETARMWADLGFYSKRKNGAFCIDAVTGPDEYTTVVDNNLYTNLMARLNLRFAAEYCRRLEKENPGAWAALTHATRLDPEEISAWERAAQAMFIPYDTDLGIYPQDDGFMDKEVWDFDSVPQDKYPLLLHFHPLTIYRHKVIKQADAVLAMFLLSSEFTLEEKIRNFNYYDPLTTGDSSLSVGIQSILAAETGHMEKASQYAEYAILMDLGDVAGNARDGLHIASMGSVWMVLVNGVAGLRDDDGTIRFHPRRLRTIKRLRIPLTVRSNRFVVDMNARHVSYTLESGEGLDIVHGNQSIHLSPDNPSFTLPYPDA
ncbi:MAG: glycoside hydrolase family 65 protein [Desulfovibrionales bacterium]